VNDRESLRGYGDVSVRSGPAEGYSQASIVLAALDQLTTTPRLSHDAITRSIVVDNDTLLPPLMMILVLLMISNKCRYCQPRDRRFNSR
jgi:hypothetical protein